RRWRNRVIGIATAVCVVAVVLLGVFFANRPSTAPPSSPHAVATAPRRPEVSPLDQLQPGRTPGGELKAAGGGDAQQSPRELVAVFGSSQPGQPGLNGLAFSPDARLLAAGTTDGKIKIWDIATGKQLHTIPAHTQAVLGLAFHPKKD